MDIGIIIEKHHQFLFMWKCEIYQTIVDIVQHIQFPQKN